MSYPKRSSRHPDHRSWNSCWFIQLDRFDFRTTEVGVCSGSSKKIVSLPQYYAGLENIPSPALLYGEIFFTSKRSDEATVNASDMTRHRYDDCQSELNKFIYPVYLADNVSCETRHGDRSQSRTTEVGVCSGLSKKIVRAQHHRSWSLRWFIQKNRQSPAPQKLEFALAYPKNSSEPCTTEVGVCAGLSKKIV